MLRALERTLYSAQSWPLWLKIVLVSPMAIGAFAIWLPPAKTLKWRATQIGFIAYFFLFAIFFEWQSIIGSAIVAVAGFGLLVFPYRRWRKPS